MTRFDALRLLKALSQSKGNDDRELPPRKAMERFPPGSIGAKES